MINGFKILLRILIAPIFFYTLFKKKKPPKPDQIGLDSAKKSGFKKMMISLAQKVCLSLYCLTQFESFVYFPSWVNSSPKNWKDMSLFATDWSIILVTQIYIWKALLLKEFELKSLEK
jgi:hypothetical protein